MDGRGFSDLCRNTSEELFLKSMMEGPIAMPVPAMEMLGFKNISQNFRTDSEELFKRWLTNGENPGYNSSSGGQTSRLSQRISTELASLSNQQNVALLSKKKSRDKLHTENNISVDATQGDFIQNSIRDAVDREQASNLFLAKAWFLSNQPMTRSRSSELRRRYAAMQNAQATLGMEVFHNAPQNNTDTLNQEFSNGFDYVSTREIPNQVGEFVSPSNSSSSRLNNPQTVDKDKVSSCVSMLRGTLERKRLGSQAVKEPNMDSSNTLYSAQEYIMNARFLEEQGNEFHEEQRNFEETSPIRLNDHGIVQTVEEYKDGDFEGFVNPINQGHLGTTSRENSQSESSAAAPVVSYGFDACDGPSNSGQTPTFSESSLKQIGTSRSPEKGHRVKDFRERIMDNLKEERKKGCLDRYGSVTSTVSVDKGDATKKRRVERSRKMAEAKERSLTPPVPSDMQAVLKRCETLEKEVRSLKLNLSFMNRKDSEQTKQIEELQKQNEELVDEKERLLEEIERILSVTGKI